MPGQGELVYVAGHRTTYLAPFAHIDSLRAGDRDHLRAPVRDVRLRGDRPQDRHRRRPRRAPVAPQGAARRSRRATRASSPPTATSRTRSSSASSRATAQPTTSARPARSPRAAGTARGEPAASSPSPRGTRTRAFASAARTIMCDSWPETGSSTTPSSVTVERARSRSSRRWVALDGDGQTAGRPTAGRDRPHPGGPASPAGRRARSRRASRPGCPAARRRASGPRTPNETGLPGRTATRQKTSSTPSSASIRRTRSCGPTETPPEVTSTSCSRPCRIASRCAPSSSATASSRVTSAPAALELRGDHRAVRLVDLAGAERRPRRTKLGAGRQDGDARTAGADDLGDPGGGKCADLRGAELQRPRRRRPPLRRPRRDRTGRMLAPLATDSWIARLCCLSRQPTRAGRPRRRRPERRLPWRSPSPLRPRATRRPATRRRSGRRPAAFPACPPRGGRSRPSPSSGTAAGRPRRCASSARTRPAASASGTVSAASGRPARGRAPVPGRV